MNPRQVDNEQIFHFTNSLVWPERGCPVFLHGLVSASHLNNKVGEVENFTTTNRLCWHIEYDLRCTSRITRSCFSLATKFTWSV
jgi:hypothetical protein